MKLTERDREIGVLLEPGMTEAQLSAERELCELNLRLQELRARDFPDAVTQPLVERIEKCRKIRGVRHISGSGGITIPADAIQLRFQPEQDGS